jgi:hypothetical protein
LPPFFEILQSNKWKTAESKGFWQWCITLWITGLVDFVHCLDTNPMTERKTNYSIISKKDNRSSRSQYKVWANPGPHIHIHMVAKCDFLLWEINIDFLRFQKSLSQHRSMRPSHDNPAILRLITTSGLTYSSYKLICCALGHTCSFLIMSSN